MNNALTINNLTVCYGKITAIHKISLTVPEGEFLGIIGPNGGGKSTLMKAILGLVPITEGEILIYGQPAKKNLLSIGYVPQFTSLKRNFPISVLESVLTAKMSQGLNLYKHFTQSDKLCAYEQLEKVGILELKDRRLSELSGGELQRMLIARALTTSPRLLLLDEPTASVDTVSRDKIYSVLKDINQTTTILLVTHDLMAVASETGSLACINQELIYHGIPKLTEEIASKMYGCPIDFIAHGAIPHRVLGEHKKEGGPYA